jgi:alcohol dehydrogenase class IV
MWNFVSPRIVFGEDSLSSLHELSGKKALVITDKTLVELGFVERVSKELHKVGFEIKVFDEVEPDPTTKTVEKGAHFAGDYKPDWILGLGGGSPLDAAKAIWVLYERPDLQPGAINPLISLGLRKKARLVTIPTTSGTGAEVTWAIVLTDPESQRKMGLGNKENHADIAVVDPALACGMPPQLTADTGLDALTHAVEGFICTWHTDITDGLCLNAAREIFANLPLAYEASQTKEPDTDKHLKAREKMHLAATAAGLGFGNSMASIAHAMGHVLGSVFQIPHGRAVGLLLPYTLEFTLQQNPGRIELLSQGLGIVAPPGRSGFELVNHLRGLSHEVGIPGSIKEAGVAEDDFLSQMEKLVDDAFNDTQMITAPRTPSFPELEKLYKYAFDGHPIDF